MTNNEIENVIQKLYSWKEHRDQINTQRKGEPGFRELNQTILSDAIKTIQYLKMKLEIQDETPKGRRL